MPGIRRSLWIVTLLILINGVNLLIQSSMFAHWCPYCPPSDPTLSEKLSDANFANVVKFISSKNGEELSMQTTTFEVVEPLPNKDRFKKGQRIEVPYGVTANAGDHFLLLGQEKGGEEEWNLPIPLDELWRVYTYLIKAPSLETPKTERLKYFLKFMDNENPIISNDAFSEFSRAEFNEVAQLADVFSRLKLRTWLEDPNPQLDVRRAFYGMVLGLCGNEDDANFLETKIFSYDPEKNRLGIEGMMAGYLLLRGQAGLTEIVKRKINSLPEDLPADDPRLTDLNAIRMTLSFLWDYRRSQFSDEQLRMAMRPFLRRPEFLDLAVIDLARWKDWNSLDYLITAYGKEPWETRTAKEKIIAFALACVKDQGAASRSEDHAAKAQKFLDSLDSAIVESVKQARGAKILNR